MCDDNKDGKLTISEILANHEVFLDSDATEYGQQLRFAHDKLWAKKNQFWYYEIFENCITVIVFNWF